MKRFCKIFMLVAFIAVLLPVAGHARPVSDPNYSTLYSFASSNDGRGPQAQPVLYGDYLYGTTYWGSAGKSSGIIYKIKKDGTGYTTLYTFDGVNGGGVYQVLSVNGTYIYGAASQGGSYSDGVLFRVKMDGTGYQILRSLKKSKGGMDIGIHLVLDGSVLYGTAEEGGDENCGTLFKLNTDGTNFTVLLNFKRSANGSHPIGGLIKSGSYLYGMANNGKTDGDGLVYKIKTDGTGFTVLHSFADSDGEGPLGTLVLSGDVLFGMTKTGGTYNVGVIFKVKTNGTGFSVLHHFKKEEKNGAEPWGTLVLSGTTLFGFTSEGGKWALGHIFNIQTDGTNYNGLYDFQPLDANSPLYGAPVLSGTALYGAGSMGGVYGMGAIFKYVIAADDLPGDVNHDGVVDIKDWSAAKAILGSRTGGAAYNANADLNSDGLIWWNDLTLLMQFIQSK